VSLSEGLVRIQSVTYRRRIRTVRCWLYPAADQQIVMIRILRLRSAIAAFAAVLA
jgi:hypothetical protein